MAFADSFPEAERIELMHADNPQVVVGEAFAAKTEAGKLTLRIRLHPKYAYLRARYRIWIEDYMGEIPWYREANFGDYYS